MLVQRVEVQRAQKKALDKMKNVTDFNHIHNGKRTDKNNEQLPKEQYKKLRQL